MSYHLRGMSTFSGIDEEFQVYLASSNSDLLNKVDSLLNKRGIVGIVDMSGNIRYILDGRRGANYAANRLESYLDDSALRLRKTAVDEEERLNNAVTRVVKRYGFRTRLAGYSLFMRMVQLCGRDPALMRPATKRLYPILAKEFRLSIPQIERNLRYFVKTALADEKAAQEQGFSRSSSGRCSIVDEGRNVTVLTLLERITREVEAECRRDEIMLQNEKGSLNDYLKI